MTGNELRTFRTSEKVHAMQGKFYMDLGFKQSYGSMVENLYGDNPIPIKLEKAVTKKYKKLLEA